MQLPSEIKSTIIDAGNYLNQPANKSLLKKTVGYVAFLLIPVATFIAPSNLSSTMKLAKISLILNGFVSPLGQREFSKIANWIFTQEQLNRLGPNTIFAVNPWHPRHVVSIAATALAIPVVIDTTSNVASWTIDKISARFSTSDVAPKKPIRVTDTPSISENMICFLTVFTFFTSRPVLHQANLVFQRTFAQVA